MWMSAYEVSVRADEHILDFNIIPAVTLHISSK